jgi:hypothetical protein
VELRDSDPDSARFAEARSFITRERHRFESTLDLASFDERLFVGALTQALKLLAIRCARRCARRYGAVYIRTHNDSENAPILAINRKLGYQPRPGLYQYALTLT